MSLPSHHHSSKPSLGLVLPSSRIHSEAVCICRQTLVLPDNIVKELRSCLAADEIVRADRFHFKKDSDRFIITRAALRYALATELQILPSEVEFQYGDHGKPSLALSMRSDIEFNVTHSGVFALLGFIKGVEIGVDIEQIRPMKDILMIARRYFSELEIEKLLRLPEAQQETAFFSIWSRKEAIVKAIGSGLSLSLASFDVEVTSPQPDEKFHLHNDLSHHSLLLEIRPPSLQDATGASNWQLYNVPAPEGYRAAVALKSCSPRLIDLVS